MSSKLQKLRRDWFTFWNQGDRFETPFTLVFSLQIALILVFYFLVRVALLRYTFLAEAAYFEPCLYLEFLKQSATKPLLLVPLIGALLVFNTKLFLPWQDLDNGKRLRNIVCFMAAILAWRHAFYQYNFYLDQPHWLDRIALWIFAALVFWRPIFVVPFLSAVLVVIGQFELTPGYSLADSLMPIHILIMFVAFYLFRLASNRFSFTNFLFMMGCVIASNYFFSGLGKVNYEWIFIDRISNILPNSHSLGWNQFMGPETLREVTNLMTLSNVPIKILTLGIELGILFFFYRLQWTRLLLFAAVFFHVGIFLSSGICFWYWSMIHIFLLIYVWRDDACDHQQLFNLRRMAFGILVIATAGQWNNPVKLAWLSKPLQTVPYAVAETDQGEALRLSPDFFGPYDYNFTFRNLYDMRPSSKAKRFGFGCSREVINFFSVERTDGEILEFEKTAGQNYSSEARRKKTKEFLERYVKNYNLRDSSHNELGWLKAPDLLWQGRGVSRLPTDTQILNLSLYCSTNYYSANSGPRVVREEKVAELFIADSTAERDLREPVKHDP